MSRRSSPPDFPSASDLIFLITQPIAYQRRIPD